MSVHFRGVCYIVDDIICQPSCVTKHNKRQPYIVMQGVASGVSVIDSTAVIV